MKIILATQSKRRIELFKKICEDFTVVKSDFDETKIEEKDPVRYAIECAVGKAKEVGEKFPESIVIGADTVVALNDEIIGKPSSYEEAKEILLKLSGTKHKVITGIAVYKKDEGKILTDYEISYVKFKKLSEEEIDEYLKKQDYMDKAGAYGIQNIKDKFVENIEGDFDNIVGLPVKKVKDLLDKFLSESVSLEITDIAFPNGWGVGRDRNFVIFVPGAVPGDRVRIKISKNLKNFSFGEIEEIEKPSEFRIIPKCKHFSLCGGCSLQNLFYEKQIQFKKEYFLQCLKKIGEFTDEINIEEIIQSPAIYFYRNKMEFAFGIENKKIVIGLRERNLPSKKYKKEIVPVEECWIFSENIKKIFPPVIDFVNSTNLKPYNPFTKKGFFRHLVIKESKRTGEIMIILVTKSGEELDFTKFIELLINQVKEIKSIYWVENNQIADVVAYERKHLLYGKPYIEEYLKNLKFRIYPDTFFQPNTFAAEILYEKILENLEEKENSILGLYCGSGGIEIYISSKAKNVVGIDWEISNINTAMENCKLNNIYNCEFYCEKVEKAILDLSGRDFTHIIVDPPRGGLSQKLIRRMAKTNISEIIYVSCNPSTLSRDLKLLKELNYYPKKIYLFDFFPHTCHIESLAIIEKIS